MKRLFILVIPGMLAFAACTNSSDTKTAVTAEKQQPVESGEGYKVDTSLSTLLWTGAKQTGKHEGEFAITDGVVTLKDGQVSGGNFTIDVAGISVKDLQGEDKAKLEGHLKSPDFFEVQKFPTAKFEITGIKPAGNNGAGATHEISGNLTLKDRTKNLSFPAKIEVTADGVAATADFAINRTDWGLNYKGPNNPQDWFIKKEVGLKLNLVAKKN